MRGRDEDTGEFLGESRSQNRREALEVLALGEQLVELTPAQLARLPIPEDLLAHIEYSKRITSHGARKRQLAFLAKQMRREEDSTLEAIRDALSANSETSRREVAIMHRIERWRERLLAEGDGALGELLEEYPQADRQQLRTLVRNAQAEKARNKPPRAYREIYQVLRALMLPSQAGGDIQQDADEGAAEDVDENDCAARRHGAAFSRLSRPVHAGRPRRCRYGCQHAAQAWVPPTVRPSINSEGWPTPTGTLCPSLPQTPTPSSRARSLPIMRTFCMVSGPLPIRVAPLTGAVILPSSIR